MTVTQWSADMATVAQVRRAIQLTNHPRFESKRLPDPFRDWWIDAAMSGGTFLQCVQSMPQSCCKRFIRVLEMQLGIIEENDDIST